jgi:DNA-binding protein HU-beta
MLLRRRSKEVIDPSAGPVLGTASFWTALLKRENAMNKADLVTRVAKDAEITKRQAEKALDALVGGVQEALLKGDSITLVGFGTFSVMSRSARKGRNPQTGQEIFIPANKTPKFKAGKGLREAVR